MGLPNATSILTTLPGGIRAIVRRDSVVETCAVRTAISESGSLSLSGLERLAKINIWTLCADFTPRVSVGDVLYVDGVPSFAVDVMTSCGNLISRANVVLCEDKVTIGDIEIPCQLGMVSQDMAMGIDGFSPDDAQGFFVPESIIPEGVEISTASPATISGKRLTVEKISRDAKYGILCVMCRRRGAE